MPIEPTNSNQGFASRNRVPELEPHDPSLWETTKAAFGLESDVYAMFELATRPAFEPDPLFTGDLLASKLKEQGFWDDYRDRFLRVRSEPEMTAVMQRIRMEEARRATLAQSGWAGVTMAVAAGVISPTSMIPLVAGGKGLRAIYQGATLGALAAGGQEMTLYASQETRTLGEAAVGVAAGTILGGILGPVVARAPREMLERAGRDMYDAPSATSTLPPVASEARQAPLSDHAGLLTTLTQRLAAAGSSSEEAGVGARIIHDAYTSFAVRSGRSVDQLIEEFGIPEIRRSTVEELGDRPTLFQPVWHGSGAIFDKFKWGDEVRGTGEGHQAFGDGIYLTDLKGLAEHYRKIATRKAVETEEFLDASGNVFTRQSLYQAVRDALYSEFNIAERVPSRRLFSLMSEANIGALGGKDLNAVKAALKIQLGALTPDEERLVGRAFELNKQYKRRVTKPGRIYKVEAPEDDELLNWDAPLKDQPEKIKAVIQGLLKQIGAGLLERFLIRKGYGLANEMTGERFYRALSDAVGGQVEASRILKEAGIPGHRFLTGRSRARGKGDYNYVIYDSERLSILEFEQSGRGAIQFGLDGKAIIHLFDKADVSTVLHESGHLFLQMLKGLGDRVDAPPALKKSWDEVKGWWQSNAKAIAKEAGVEVEQVRAVLKEGTSGDAAIDRRIDVALHEQWARAFEVYLREGKAPSKGLQKIFDQFKEWLSKIYNDAKELGVELSPEIRKVFDELLAPPQVKDDFELHTEGTLAGLSADAVSQLPSLKGLKKPVRGTQAIFNWLSKLGPVTRLAQVYDSQVGKQMVRWIGRAGLTFEEEARGAASIPSATGGNIESRIKRWHAGFDRLIESIDREWADEVWGGNVPLTAKLDPTARFSVPQGQRTREEFQSAVGRYMFDETQEATPQVKRVAEVARKEIYEPLFKEAQATGAIPAEFKQILADPTYLNRVWREEMIAQHFDTFVRRMAAHVRGKLEDEFRDLTEKLLERQARDEQDILDINMSGVDAARLYREFEKALKELDEGRSPEITEIESSLDVIREELQALRAGDLENLPRDPTTGRPKGVYIAQQELKEARKKLREAGGEELTKLEAERTRVRRRLRALSRNQSLMADRLAAKLERIDRAEQLQYDTILRLAKKGQKILNQLDEVSPEEVDRLVGELAGDFAREGKQYDKLVAQSVEMANDPEVQSLVEAGVKLDESAGKLNRFAEEIEQLENVDRDAIENVLLKAAVEAENLMARRTRRLDRLREAAEKLGPDARKSRVAKIKERQAARLQKYNEKVRQDLKATDFDLEARKVDVNDYAQQLALAIANKLLGVTDRLPTMELIMDKRGAELARGIDAPSLDFVDVGPTNTTFVETDIERLAMKYLNTLAPDVEISRRFGNGNADEWLGPDGKLRHEYDQKKLRAEQDEVQRRANRQIDSKEKKEGRRLSREEIAEIESAIKLNPEEKRELLKGIDDEHRAVQRDLVGLIERLKGMRGRPREPRGWMARAARSALNLNATRFLGGTVIASLPDLGRLTMKYGLERSFRDGFGAFIKNTKLMQLSRREAKLARSSDVITHARTRQVFDIMDNYRFGTKPEKALEWLASRVGKFGLFDRWTDYMKQLASSVVTARIFDDMRILNEGGTAEEVASATEFLSKMGFDGPMIERAWKEVTQTPDGGEQVDGLWLPNTEAWEDQDLAFSFHAALAQEVDDAIVTPGLEVPLAVDANLATRLLFQFKRFGLSSVQKSMMAGLQERDARALMGIMISLASGAFSYYIWAIATGGRAQEEMENAGVGKWADEAIARSGILGIFSDVQNVAQRIPLTQPFASFSGRGSAARAGEDLISALMGPTWDAVEQAGGVLVDLNDPTASTVHKFRTLIPYQNMFYLRRLFTMAEEGAVGALGLPDRRQ